MTTLEVIALSTRLLGFSLFVQAIEHLRLGDASRKILAPSGGTLARALSGFVRPLALGIAALSLGALATSDPRFLLGALPLAYLVCLRFGGTFNGGSDYLTFVVGLPLAIFAVTPTRRVASGALLFIGVQLLLSYVVAGVSKLRAPEWRTGTALELLAEREHYSLPPLGKRLLKKRSTSRFLTFATIAFECAAPLALTGSRFMLAYLALALVFHGSVAWLLGLNRFLWAWLAAFPSAWFLAVRLSS